MGILLHAFIIFCTSFVVEAISSDEPTADSSDGLVILIVQCSMLFFLFLVLLSCGDVFLRDG